MNFIRKAINFVKNVVKTVRNFFSDRIRKVRTVLARMTAVAACARGENYVDSGVKILIAVVVGALLLAGLYALFGDVVLPSVTQRVTDMFIFNG